MDWKRQDQEGEEGTGERRRRRRQCREEDQDDQYQAEEGPTEEGGEEETPKEKDEVANPDNLTPAKDRKRPRENSTKRQKASKTEQPEQSHSFPAGPSTGKWQKFAVQPSEQPKKTPLEAQAKNMVRVKRSASTEALEEKAKAKPAAKAKTTAAKTRAAKATQSQPSALPKSASASNAGHFDLMAESCLRLKSVDDTALLYGLLPLLSSTS